MLDFAERKIVTSQWYFYWSMARAEKRRAAHPAPTSPRVVPHTLPPMHTLTCALCGEQVTSMYGCEHPNAPEAVLPSAVPIRVPPKDSA